jgi:hypothetical protein
MTVIAASAIARTPAAADIPAVRARLAHARWRWRLWSVLQGVVWSVVLGLVVFCALEVIAIFLNGPAAERWLPVLSGSPPLNHVALSVIIFACALAGAVLVTFLIAPDLAAFARAADRTFALQERLSTALEVAAVLRPDTAPDPVRAALLADAERRAGAVDPCKLVRLTLPRMAWVVPALLTAAILLQVLPPGAFGRAAPGATVERDASDDGGLSRQQAAETAANLRLISEILDQDAAQRSDPYLRTIARTLARLSSEVAQSTMDRRVLANELHRLLAHTQQAYAQGERPVDQTASRRDAVELLRSALDDITGNRQGGAAATPDPNHDVREAAANLDPAGRPGPPQERKASSRRTPSELIAAARKLPGADIPWLFVDEDGAEVDPRSQIERLMAEKSGAREPRRSPPVPPPMRVRGEVIAPATAPGRWAAARPWRPASRPPAKCCCPISPGTTVAASASSLRRKPHSPALPRRPQAAPVNGDGPRSNRSSVQRLRRGIARSWGATSSAGAEAGVHEPAHACVAAPRGHGPCGADPP